MVCTTRKVKGKDVFDERGDVFSGLFCTTPCLGEVHGGGGKVFTSPAEGFPEDGFKGSQSTA